MLNHPPPIMARLLAPGGAYIPNSVGAGGRLLAGLPRIARATLMGRFGRADVRAAACVIDHEHLSALAALLESGQVKPVIDSVHPLRDAGDAVAHMLGHHARGNIVITV